MLFIAVFMVQSLDSLGVYCYTHYMKIDLQNLPTNLDFLHQLIADLVKENLLLQDQNASLQHQLILLKLKRFGASSEKLNTEKLDEQIAELEERIEDSELSSEGLLADEEADKSTKPKNQAKRKKLPEHLPRVDNIINPDPICPECGGENWRKIDDDISEILEYVPSSFKVIRNIRPRCACTTCEKIVQAFPPSQTIDRGKAGPGLLAHILLQKYCNHLPFYRQSQIYGYEDIDLSRSTMTGWAKQCSKLLTPLIDEIKKAVFLSPQIHGDDTIVKVLSPGLGKTKTGRIWTYVRDGRPHGDIKIPPAVCYFYSPDRKGERPAVHLKDFAGILHADAYGGYDQLYIGNTKNPEAKITEAACWAHTRRKFYEVTQTSNKAKIAQERLIQIAEIYKIEEEIKGLAPYKRGEIRQERSRDLVTKLFASWKKHYGELPKKSPTAQAIAYAQNNQAALMRFLDNGKIEIGRVENWRACFRDSVDTPSLSLWSSIRTPITTFPVPARQTGWSCPDFVESK